MIAVFDKTSYSDSIVAIFPPIIAILAAFILKQVVVALFMGIWFGAWLINGGDLQAVILALIDVSNKYAVNVLVNESHIVIILASLFIGGLMNVISFNGGMRCVVKAISRKVKSIKQVQLATVVMGLVIFFDDYANTLVTGNTMRPVTDKMKISREKLAYIVDSTAAPVASVAVISLWIGYLVSLIEQSISSIEELTEPYAMFIQSLFYSFYPFLAIIFVLIVILTGKDFGPMYRAEQKAFSSHSSVSNESDNDAANSENNVVKGSVHIALIPIATLILTVILGMWFSGSGETLQDIIGSSDSLAALAFGGFLGSIVAILLSVLTTSLTLTQVFDAWLSGVNSVMGAVVVLVLSWSLAEVTTEMQSANYLISIIGNDISPALLPSIIFILAGIIALGTGTSWGVMAILMPLVVPLSWSLISNPENSAALMDIHILYASIAAVLAGAVWGDHCSPISDTTILSSLASQCDHVEHVRTQMPYALVVGSVCIIFGTLPVGFGQPWWLCFLMSAFILWLVLKVIGKKLIKT